MSGADARPRFFLKYSVKPNSVAAAAMHSSASTAPQRLPVLYRPFSSKAVIFCSQRQNTPNAEYTQPVHVIVRASLRI